MHTQGKWQSIVCDGMNGWRISIEAGPHQVCGIKPKVSASGFLSKKQHIANAKRICLCVNSHDDLLAACRAAVYILKQKSQWAENLRNQPWYSLAEKAIAQAEAN